MNNQFESTSPVASGSGHSNRNAASEGEDMLTNVHTAMNAAIATERKREIAIEHLLFQTVGYVERIHPGLLTHLEDSISNLGDPARDDSKDDEAVRDIARRFLRSLRLGAS